VVIPALIIGFFAGLSLLVGLLVLWQRLVMVFRGVRTTGRVVSGVSRVQHQAEGRPRVTHAPVIEVVDPSNGQRFTFKSSFSSSATRLRIGERLPVRLVPGEPSAAEIDRLLPMWFLPVSFIGFGIFLIWVLGRI